MFSFRAMSPYMLLIFVFWMFLLSETSACSKGRFGKNCELTCHCKGGDDNCEESGFCSRGCAAGWAGFNCEFECPDGRFGENCRSRCHCKDGRSACDRFTGVCTGGCAPGFIGTSCQTECRYGTYGINCVHACTCLNNGQCSKIDGSCSCRGRWRGTICNESEPYITVSIEEVNVGQEGIISCKVDAFPEPTMNITSDEFPELSFHIRQLEQDQYEVFAEVKSSEAGDIEFLCFATNKYGSNNALAVLSVIAPPRLLKQPELQSSDNTSLVVKWDKWEYGKDEGGAYGDSVEYMVVYRKTGSTEWLKPESWKTNRTSTLENLEPGTGYQVAVTCRRPGKGGEGEPGPFLNVKTRLTGVSQIITATDEEVDIGQDTLISCTIDAIPQPTVNIMPDTFTASSLHFRKLQENQYQAVARVRFADAGHLEFSCTARNQNGFDHKIVSLSVTDVPAP